MEPITTQTDVEALAALWLATNKKTPADVRHELYPIGFVAALIEQLQRLGAERLVLPTPRCFAYNYESVVDAAELARQRELKRRTDQWLVWRSAVFD